MTVRTALGAADEVGSATAFTSHEGVTPVMGALRKEGLERRLVMLPRWENSQLVLHAAHGTGNWIGATSALIHGDYIHLRYRDRNPVDKGRGSRAYVARSPS
jgi:transcription-repair coupling factor (superfamily II helicase)